MKNSADQGGCYPHRPKAEVDNTLRDLQNSSYPTKAEFNDLLYSQIVGGWWHVRRVLSRVFEG